MFVERIKQISGRAPHGFTLQQMLLIEQFQFKVQYSQVFDLIFDFFCGNVFVAYRICSSIKTSVDCTCTLFFTYIMIDEMATA